MTECNWWLILPRCSFKTAVFFILGRRMQSAESTYLVMFVFCIHIAHEELRAYTKTHIAQRLTVCFINYLNWLHVIRSNWTKRGAVWKKSKAKISVGGENAKIHNWRINLFKLKPKRDNFFRANVEKKVSYWNTIRASLFLPSEILTWNIPNAVPTCTFVLKLNIHNYYLLIVVWIFREYLNGSSPLQTKKQSLLLKMRKIQCLLNSSLYQQSSTITKTSPLFSFSWGAGEGKKSEEFDTPTNTEGLAINWYTSVRITLHSLWSLAPNN